jgi:hypothetical protein
MWIQEFLNCLKTSTLKHPKEKEAFAIKEQHLPTCIYKYRQNSNYSRENLRTDTVWLASPESYNDPYDCAFKLLDEPVTAALEKGVIDQLRPIFPPELIERAKNSLHPFDTIAELSTDLGAGDYGMTRQQVTEFLSRSHEHIVKFLRQLQKRTKICSFSARNDSILMWSHYADNHRGFCIEYKLEGLEPSHPFRRKLYPVIYSDDLYDLAFFVESLAGPNRADFTPMAPILPLLHKFSGWKYEEEWRVVEITDPPKDDYSWQAVTPTRVLLGSKMEVAENQNLLAICEQRRIEVQKMNLAKDRFELRSERL